jgi:heme-degrading monooxygenase HmoA
MFLVNEILVFSPGRRQEGEDRLAWIHSLMAPNPGFKQALVAKYLGDPFRNTVLRFWDNIEAYQKFRETPDGNYGRNRPEGLYTNERVVPQWDSIHETEGSAQGDFLVKVHREVPENGWDSFTQAIKVAEPALKSNGVVYARHFRARDQNQALTVARFQSRENVERFTASPEYLKMIQSMPEGVVPGRIEFFEVVSDVGPK